MFKMPERITLDNAAAFESELLEAQPETLDAAELTYISSVGLRVLLKLFKKIGKKPVIENVSPEVYEIFEATGFIDLAEIHKRIREVSIEGLEVLGHGSNGDVYRLDDERIIKVYNAPWLRGKPDKAKGESEISREVFKSGISTAISFDIVKCGENYAAIYEIIKGRTLGEEISDHPEKLEDMIALLAEAGRQLHHTKASPEYFPDILKKFKSDGKKLDNIWKDDAEKEKWAALADAIPHRQNMVHTDFHYDNVMVQNNEPVLIDVGGICAGHPVFDFMTMYLRATRPGLAATRFPAETEKKIFDIYIDRYFEGRLNEENKKLLLKVFEWIGNNVLLVIGIKKSAFKDDKVLRSMAESILSIEPDELKSAFDVLDKELFV